MIPEFSHKPVLLNECINGLNINPKGIYVDGTVGGGGHSAEIIKKLAGGLLVGIDRDENAIKTAERVLAGSGMNRKTPSHVLVRDNFSNIPAVLDELSIPLIDGCLLDLGVSSHQLDTAERGFSYMNDAPLDMRMDTRQRLTAYDVVNLYDIDKLSKLIFSYGEERYARRIASRIEAARQRGPIKTTAELSDIIIAAIPAAARREGPHPAKRTFQAIRIEVNDELNILTPTVSAVISRIKPGGRLAVITFHSLEDRLIKNAFMGLTGVCICPPGLPICACGAQRLVQVITKKPILPTEGELQLNHRARSAKLRIAERV